MRCLKWFIGEFVEGKRVVFVTTKNADYIRNVQEINILKENAAELTIVCSKRKSYAARLLEIWCKLLFLGTDCDTVFFGFAPQLVAPFFIKYWKKAVVIDFFVSMYDTFVNDRKKISERSFIAKLFHIIDEYVIKKADFVITDTKADAEYFIREFGGESQRFCTVYLEADKTIYFPREQHKRKDLEDKFVVLYFGSMLPLQGVEVVLGAVRLLRNEENIFFQIIGPVPGKYEKPCQDNVEYIDWLAQAKLAEYVANADLCLVGHFNGNIDKAKRTIPGKAYIYSAMGKQMVLGDNRANREFFDGDDNVIWTAMGDAKALARVIVGCARR